MSGMPGVVAIAGSLFLSGTIILDSFLKFSDSGSNSHAVILGFPYLIKSFQFFLRNTSPSLIPIQIELFPVFFRECIGMPFNLVE